MSTLEDYFFTKNTKWFFWGAGALILALLIFHAGYVLGSRRDLPNSSNRDFRPYGFGLPGGFMPPKTFMNGGHGAAGTISSISLPTLTLKSDDGDDSETIVLTASTSIREAAPGMPPQDASSSALTVGEHVVVLGLPQGSSSVKAELIDIH